MGPGPQATGLPHEVHRFTEDRIGCRDASGVRLERPLRDYQPGKLGRQVNVRPLEHTSNQRSATTTLRFADLGDPGVGRRNEHVPT